jgi:hypothetical protein
VEALFQEQFFGGFEAQGAALEVLEDGGWGHVKSACDFLGKLVFVAPGFELGAVGPEVVAGAVQFGVIEWGGVLACRFQCLQQQIRPCEQARAEVKPEPIDVKLAKFATHFG